MKLKPVLQWVGGKRQLLPELLKRMPEKYNMYHQPFFGAGTPFWDLQPKKAVISDLNWELINLYKVIRDMPERLIQELNVDYINNPERFYYIRSWDRSNAWPVHYQPWEIAARTLYLNKTCFNGLYRLNGDGKFNASFGKHTKDPDWERELIMEMSRYLNCQDIIISEGDFEQEAMRINPGDFCYFDPPYSPASNTANFTKYTGSGFTEKDQTRLKLFVDRLTENNVKCMISNSNTLLITKLWHKYKIDPVSARRSVNSDPENRGSSMCEVIITNY